MKKEYEAESCREDLVVRMSSSQSISIGGERKAENHIIGPTLHEKNRVRSAKYRRCAEINKNLRRLRTSELRVIVTV
jgi:hypothetical protein